MSDDSRLGQAAHSGMAREVGAFIAHSATVFSIGLYPIPDIQPTLRSLDRIIFWSMSVPTRFSSKNMPPDSSSAVSNYFLGLYNLLTALFVKIVSAYDQFATI
jgi:hypothetical protein